MPSDQPFSASPPSPLALMALQQIEGLGPLRLAQLLSRAGSLAQLFAGAVEPQSIRGLGARGRRQLQALLRSPQQSPLWERAERTQQWLASRGGEVLVADDSRFPSPLKALSDCPPLLYLIGDAARLQQRMIAVVGARQPSISGGRFAAELSADLAAAGELVVSGMARGIDTAAHRGALSRGATAAVWATGLDRVYPAANRPLAEEIAERGCLISEMPLGSQPRPGAFPRRNRIISGLSVAVVVVEAALPSGSLTTASYAADQGREVFAVPGSVYNPRARGCHQLLRDGATLVESAADILDALPAPHPVPRDAQGCRARRGEARDPALLAALSPAQRQLLALLSFDPLPYHWIAERYNGPSGQLQASLVELELQGLVRVEGGLYCRCGGDIAATT